MRLRPLQPKFLLPTMVFAGVLMVGVRIHDVWDTSTSGKLFSPVAPAAAEATAPLPLTPTAASKDGARDAKEEKQTPASPPPSQARSNDDSTGTEMALAKQLSERRDQLDERSRTLDTRDALIHVAEQRVDQKIKEMETLRAQLQSMVNQLSATQQAQIENLVKIYETMKPKEAARIFETLEMPVLLGVVQKMKPQRTSAVMAEMAPQKAKELTVALTKQDQLPDVK
ncbi:MAG: hypothetical protein HGA90_01130 [Alphaproteobacteria bacterium]|nr:hypothetical protein [Alphaproteobacteria bacterium]